MRCLIGGLVVVAVVVLIAAFYPNENAPEGGPEQLIGSRLPSLTLPALNGAPLQTADLNGRPVLLNLWATWCGPCRREMPALALLAHQMVPNLQIVSIDQGEDARVVNAYVKRFHVDFPIFLDRDQQFGTMMHLVGLPSSFFIDRHGVVQYIYRGRIPGDVLGDQLSKLASS
jgi:cytochrome c biogenesis protein CcmG, thiol:disulfide interchange protein DsbE